MQEFILLVFIFISSPVSCPSSGQPPPGSSPDLLGHLQGTQGSKGQQKRRNREEWEGENEDEDGEDEDGKNEDGDGEGRGGQGLGG
jgi:hypothetical protein